MEYQNLWIVKDRRVPLVSWEKRIYWYFKKYIWFYCALITKKTMNRAENDFYFRYFVHFICSICSLLFSIWGKVSTLLLDSVPAAKEGLGCTRCPRGGGGNLAGWPWMGDLVTGWNEWGGSCSGGRTSILLTGMPLVTVEIAVFFSEISSRNWRTSFSRRIRR